jgi:hypothetical protein
MDSLETVVATHPWQHSSAAPQQQPQAAAAAAPLSVLARSAPQFLGPQATVGNLSKPIAAARPASNVDGSVMDSQESVAASLSRQHSSTAPQLQPQAAAAAAPLSVLARSAPQGSVMDSLETVVATHPWQHSSAAPQQQPLAAAAAAPLSVLARSVPQFLGPQATVGNLSKPIAAARPASNVDGSVMDSLEKEDAEAARSISPSSTASGSTAGSTSGRSRSTRRLANLKQKKAAANQVHAQSNAYPPSGPDPDDKSVCSASSHSPGSISRKKSRVFTKPSGLAAPAGTVESAGLAPDEAALRPVLAVPPAGSALASKADVARYYGAP